MEERRGNFGGKIRVFINFGRELEWPRCIKED